MAVERPQKERTRGGILVHEQVILVHLPRVVGDVPFLGLSGIHSDARLGGVRAGVGERTGRLIQTKRVNPVQTHVVAINRQPPSNHLHRLWIRVLGWDLCLVFLIPCRSVRICFRSHFPYSFRFISVSSFILHGEANPQQHYGNRMQELRDCRRHHSFSGDPTQE